MFLRHGSLTSVLYNHLISYPTPSNINYFWGFGSTAGICLVLQMVTGICLAMHYTPHVDLAFNSIEHIMRDVNYGWLLRYLHANGASIFFIIVYIHIARGLYFKSYRNLHLWSSGVIIFILMMATAFMGYVLPWGQMSFWGATVITNLFSAIPVVGQSIAFWLWGGFSVDNATLNRFFSLHYLLPFLIAGLVIAHLALLHSKGSSNPLLGVTTLDYVTFYPYLYLKDLLGLLIMIFGLSYLVFFEPNLLGHPDNYIKANPLVTPLHIVPEWYFLPFYAILRSIPNKLAGVAAMGLSIAILLILPFIKEFTLITKYSFIEKKLFWLFIIDVILLGFLGGSVAEQPFIFVSQLATLFYFVLLIL